MSTAVSLAETILKEHKQDISQFTIVPSDGGRFEVTGRAIVTMDSIGAGEGQLVLIVQGSSARLAEGLAKVPVDAVVVGIVDEAVVHGKRVG